MLSSYKAEHPDSSIAGGGSGGVGGVVAAASAGYQLAAAARGDDFHNDVAEGAIALGVGGIVGQGVLVADVVGDLFADVVDVVDVFRKVGQAARGFGDVFEGFPGVLGALFAFLAEQTDGVDHRIGLLDFADGSLQGVVAGVVFAVGDDEQDAFVLGSFFEMVERADDGVVERGAATGIDALEGFLQFRNAVGEVFVEVEIKIVVEIDDESFVLLVAGFHQGDGRFVDAGALVAHAAAVINDQTHADGNVFALEDGKFLLAFILEDTKIFFLESVGKPAAIVEHGGVQHDEADVDFDAAAGLGRALRLVRRKRLRIRKGNLRERSKRQQTEATQEKREEKTASAGSESPSGPGRSSRSWSRR